MNNRVESAMKVVELTGRVDEQGCLHLDEPLTGVGPSRVRVLVLYSAEGDIDEKDWLRAAAGNQAFDFLRHPSEDLYTVADGKPFRDAR